MDDFIKKQLEDYSSQEDGWNVPSEKHWIAAKEHFPKKKKKRRPLFLILSFLTVAAAMSLILWTMTDKEHAPSTIAETSEVNTIPRATKSNTSASRNQSDQEHTAENEIIEGETDKNEIEKTAVPVKTNESKNIITADLSKNSTDPIERNQETTNHSNGTRVVVPQAEISNSKKSSMHDRNETKELSASKIKTTNALNSLSVPKPKSAIHLASLESISKRYLQNENSYEKPLPVLSTAILAAPTGFYEIGLARKNFLLNLLDFEASLTEDEELEQGSSFVVDRSLINANLVLNKYFNRRWSLSTGLHVSRLKIGIDASINTLFENTDLDMFSVNGPDELIQSRNGGLSQTGLEIELIEGVELMDKDVLNFQFDIDLRVIAFEIPLIFNYHFYKSNFEFALGVGLHLEYLLVSQNEIEVFIFKDSEQINLEAIQAADSERILDHSYYLKFGTKYLINENINLGLSLNGNLTEFIFSFAEAGLYYRFH